jgi:hypothetical protein
VADPDAERLASIMRSVQPAPEGGWPSYTAAPPPTREQMRELLREAMDAAWRDMSDYRPPVTPPGSSQQPPDPLPSLTAALDLLPKPLRYQRSQFAPTGQLWVVDPPLATHRLVIIPTGPAGDRAIALLEAAGLTLEPADGTEMDMPFYPEPIYTAPPLPPLRSLIVDVC